MESHTTLQEAAASSLLHEGEMCLLKGNYTQGLALFERVLQLRPSDANLLYEQGLALFEYGSREGGERALLLAAKKLRTALALCPTLIEGWHVLGNILLALGTVFRNMQFFLEAEEKVRRAIELSAAASPCADLFWDYATIWLHLFECSGEAIDLSHALEAFQRACSLPEALPAEFWNEFARASLELGCKVNDVRCFVKAVGRFKHALSLSPNSYESWVGLAASLHRLYLQTHDEDHFSQANECFQAAVQLRPQAGSLWLAWARFLCDSGAQTHELKRLRACIEKCHHAFARDPYSSEVLRIWAEALALLGGLTERLDLLMEAQNKIAQAEEKSSEDPELCYSHGVCLQACGHYFQDNDYYYQAIEKFQQGLTLDRTRHHLWHAMASAYATVGESEGEQEALEKACRFYLKAIDLHICSTYIFDYACALSRLGELSHSQRWVEEALVQFERALSMQRNASHLHPEWLFHYARTLDMGGEFYEESLYYVRAIEIFSHVLMLDPDFPGIHHHIALAFAHLGELLGEIESTYRALYHYRLAHKRDEENEQIILDWALTLIHIAQRIQEPTEADQVFRDAEHKLVQSAKLGNAQAYYHLGCLYSILGQYDKAMAFMEKAGSCDALPSLEEILQDDWLDGLRSTSDFQEFLSQLEGKPNLKEEG